MKLVNFKIIFFFIPHHHIGGAERVHLNIIKALNFRPIVFFDYSDSKVISKEFNDSSFCFFTTGLKRKRIAVYFVQLMSLFFPVILFGSNSPFFYEMLTKVKKSVRSIDLTHAFTSSGKGMENISLGCVDKINSRIVINTKTLEDYELLYKSNGVPSSLMERFKIIANGVKIHKFDYAQIESRFQNFTIGFVGRNSPEKRPELFFEIVKKLKVKAKVIGDHFESYKKEFPAITYFENCNDEALIRQQFLNISALIVSSSSEGFPLVIMEAMELGIPVISTDVGSIFEHVNNNENGFLLPVDDKQFINGAIQKINKLSSDKELYVRISTTARAHAVQRFEIAFFNEQYQELFYE